MTTPADIIKRAYRYTGAIASGELPTAQQQQDSFEMLNDMLQEASNESMMIAYQAEIVHPITGGTYNYVIGGAVAANPNATGIINASFVGSTASNVLTVTSTNYGAVTVGMTLVGNTTPFTSNTYITAFQSGNTNAPAGTYLINQQQTVASQTITGLYPLPMQINTAFVRVAGTIGNLDYPVAILSREQYETIGMKALNGPWPRALYYERSAPMGSVTYWPNPTQGEMHLICDVQLQQFFNLTDTIVMRQAYENWMRYELAARLMPEVGKSDEKQIAMITKFAAMAKGAIKRSNMKPPKISNFDEVLTPKRGNDAGWILHGGFL